MTVIDNSLMDDRMTVIDNSLMDDRMTVIDNSLMDDRTPHSTHKHVFVNLSIFNSTQCHL